MDLQNTGQQKGDEALRESREAMCHSFSGNMETSAKSFSPIASRLASTNLEVVSLLSRRARAYLEVPARAAACRTPQDVVNAQMVFWQHAARHYNEAGMRVMSAWTGRILPTAASTASSPATASNSTVPGTGMSNPWAANPWAAWMNTWAGASAERQAPRDYITLQDKKSPLPDNEKKVSPDGRKAA